MLKFKKRNLLKSSVIIPAVLLLSNCSKTGEEESPVTEKEVATKTEEQVLSSVLNSVLSNGCLVFGADNFYVSQIVVMDLGSRSSSNFYKKHSDALQMSNNYGLALVDHSDLSEESHGGFFALNAAAVALSIFEISDVQVFWDFLSRVFEELDKAVEEDDEEGHSHAPQLSVQQILDIAVEVGANEKIRELFADEENNLPVKLVRNMSMIQEYEETPVLLEDGEVSEVDVDDENAVNNWLMKNI